MKNQPSYFRVTPYESCASVHRKPKAFSDRVKWSTDYANRVKAFHADRKAAGIEEKVETTTDATALLSKLKPLAVKHCVPLEVRPCYVNLKIERW